MSELLPPLPGAGTLDASLVEQAVARLNHIYETRGLQTALEVAQTVLDLFFEGDPEAFASRSGAHASLDAVMKHPDLRLDKTFVWRSVRIYEQVQSLPVEVANKLTFTHHTKLLPLRGTDERAELARRAAEEGWGVRQLAEEVEEARAKKGDPVSRRGKHPVVKKVDALVRTLDKLEALLAEEQERMTDEEVAAVVEKLDRAQGRVAEVRHDVVRGIGRGS